MKTILGAGLLAATLLSFSTESAGAADGPLPPGKPAGVKAAVDRNYEGYILLGAAAVGAVLFVAIFDFGSSTSGTGS